METTDHAMENWSDERTFAIEDSLWWAKGRRMMMRSLLNPFKPINRIVDVGCGSGGNMPVLSEFGSVTGVDISDVLAAKARRRGYDARTGDVFEIDFGQVDVYALMDVLEHIEDDNGFIRRLASCSPGHLLLISVPACPWLYSDHDRQLQHYRRYTRSSLKDVLEQNGYDVLHMNHFMCLLFPAVAMARLRERIIPKKRKEIGLGIVPRPINAALTGLMWFETKLGKFIRYPVGLSVFAVARPRNAHAKLPH